MAGPDGFADVTRLPICIRLHGPWFQVGPAIGLPEDEGFRERVEQERRAIRMPLPLRLLRVTSLNKHARFMDSHLETRRSFPIQQGRPPNTGG